MGGVVGCTSDHIGLSRDQACLPIARGGVGLVRTRVLAPVAFIGSYALAAPALASAFQQHGLSFGPFFSTVDEGGLRTQIVLREARELLHPTARAALPPYATLAVASIPHLQPTLLDATHAAAFEVLVASTDLATSRARLRSASGPGAGHWLQASPIIPSLRIPLPLFLTAVRLRLGFPHPCLATYDTCACGNSMDALGTHLMRCSRGGERTSSHDSVRDSVYHILRESGQHVQRERTGFLPSSAPGGRGGRVDIVISDLVEGHILVDVVIADPTRRDLVDRAACRGLVAAEDAERRKETHYRDRAAGTKFIPFALETYGALSDASNRLLVDCAHRAAQLNGRSGRNVSLLVTWFRQRVSVALQRSLAHAIHARTLRLEEGMALLPPPPPRVLLSSAELRIVARLF